MSRVHRLRQTTLRAASVLAAGALLLALLVAGGSIARANPTTTVHDFPDPTVLPADGSNPWGALVQDSTTGMFYGTTRFGGTHGMGTVFRMTPGFVVTILHSFSGPDGANPTCALVLNHPTTSSTPATLYGTTLRGGKTTAGYFNMGTVFHISTTGAGFHVMHVFTGAPNDGAFPYAGVIFINPKVLAGTTLLGGQFKQGTTYLITIAGGPTTITHSFMGLSVAGAVDGAHPYARLLQYAPGFVMGTCSVAASTANDGCVFVEQVSGAGYNMIHIFTGTPDGARPTAELIPVPNSAGSLLYWGTTTGGGAFNRGTAYQLDPTGGSYADNYDFGAFIGDSETPWGGLFYWNQNNTIYGTARSGGVFGYGTVYKLTNTSPSAETVIHDWDPFGNPNDGSYPVAALIFNPTDGLLYSTCTNDGLYMDGIVFNIVP